VRRRRTRPLELSEPAGVAELAKPVIDSLSGETDTLGDFRGRRCPDLVNSGQ
jgi:hypothetical protein